MHSFKDAKDHTWTFDLNGDTLRRLKKGHAVDLTELTTGNPPLSLRLARDPVFQIEVIYILLERDIEAAKITPDEFAGRLSPAVLRDAGHALEGELIDFFDQLGRADLAEVVRTQSTFLGKAKTRSLSRLEKIDLDELLNQAEAEADAKFKMPLLKSPPPPPQPSGNSSTNSRESSDATPTNTV